MIKVFFIIIIKQESYNPQSRGMLHILHYLIEDGMSSPEANDLFGDDNIDSKIGFRGEEKRPDPLDLDDTKEYSIGGFIEYYGENEGLQIWEDLRRPTNLLTCFKCGGKFPLDFSETGTFDKSECKECFSLRQEDASTYEYCEFCRYSYCQNDSFCSDILITKLLCFAIKFNMTCVCGFTARWHSRNGVVLGCLLVRETLVVLHVELGKCLPEVLVDLVLEKLSGQSNTRSILFSKKIHRLTRRQRRAQRSINKPPNHRW